MNTVGLILAAVGLGYTLRLMRPVKSLIDWNWRRAMWGSGKRITIADGLLWMVLHPVLVARTWPRSPWYQEPEPVKPIRLNPDFFKERASDRADS